MWLRLIMLSLDSLIHVMKNLTKIQKKSQVAYLKMFIEFINKPWTFPPNKCLNVIILDCKMGAKCSAPLSFNWVLLLSRIKIIWSFHAPKILLINFYRTFPITIKNRMILIRNHYRKLSVLTQFIHFWFMDSADKDNPCANSPMSFASILSRPQN